MPPSEVAVGIYAPVGAGSQTTLVPAYAGSTFRGGLARKGCRAHPRLRGEHTKLAFSQVIAQGSSPLTRGALWGRILPGQLVGLIPAYAGSTMK